MWTQTMCRASNLEFEFRVIGSSFCTLSITRISNSTSNTANLVIVQKVVRALAVAPRRAPRAPTWPRPPRAAPGVYCHLPAAAAWAKRAPPCSNPLASARRSACKIVIGDVWQIAEPRHTTRTRECSLPWTRAQCCSQCARATQTAEWTALEALRMLRATRNRAWAGKRSPANRPNYQSSLVDIWIGDVSHIAHTWDEVYEAGRGNGSGTAA